MRYSDIDVTGTLNVLLTGLSAAYTYEHPNHAKITGIDGYIYDVFTICLRSSRGRS